jgi:Na+/melibiose symporter-like transporter
MVNAVNTDNADTPGGTVAGMSVVPIVAGSESDSAQPAAPSAAAVAVAARHKGIWTAGTLVYGISGLVLLFSWLLWGDFALSMRERSVGPLIEKFLLKNGAGNTLKQLLTATLPTVIALILGPAISYKSDRTRSRWGRRIPYLLIPTPIAGLAMIGIAFSPQMGEALYRAMGNTPAADVSIHVAASAYTLSIFTVLWTIFEVAVIISGAVFGGLINDVVPRPVLGRFHGLFRAVSLFDGILFNSLLFQHAEAHFTLMFALVGVLFGGGFTLMCLKVKEGVYPPPPPEDQTLITPHAGFAGWLDAFFTKFIKAAIGYLRECFSQPYYLLCFAMFTLSALTFRPINEFTIRYAAQLKMGDGDYGFLIAGSYVCSLILAFPLGMLVDRFHPIRMAFVALFLYSITALYGSLFIHDAATFGIALVAHTVLSGTYFTCAASIAQQLLPRSKFSQYASAGGIVAALVSLAYAPVMGLILDFTKRPVMVDGVQQVINGVPQYTFGYRLTFWAALILSVMTMAVTLVVYRRFVQYGGTKAYLAPGDDDPTPARRELPAHLVQIIALYFIGAAVGVAAGYVLGYVANSGAVSKAGVNLAHFHTLLLQDKNARNLTTLCVAIGVIPFAVLGGWAGSHWAKRGKTGAVAH